MTTVKFFTADAFADGPFAGNPAAVVPLDGPADAGWMQRVAAEFNLSETAFVRPLGEGVWSLRWFTPAVEVDLCGHATLAAAHVMGEAGLPPADAVAFDTRSGRLTAERRGGLIWLDFPSEAPEACEAPGGLAEALGAAVTWVGRNRMDYFVEVDGEAAVRGLTPDMGRLARLPARGVVVTAASRADGVDFVSRFFAPAAGVPEDPVTGSAHCALAPFWAARLGRFGLTGYQASARGGAVRVESAGGRVRLGGRCVTVTRGEILIPPPA